MAISVHDEEVLGKAYDGRLARRLLAYARPHKHLIGASVGLLLLDGALQLVGPLLTRHVIDVAVPARDGRTIVLAAAAFAVVLVLQFALAYSETQLTTRLGQRVIHDLRVALFSHVQRLPVSFFDRNPVGRLVTRVTSDIESLNELFTTGVVAGVGDLFTLGTISLLMLWVDWRLALAAFAVIPFILLVSALFRVHVRRSYREIRTRLAKINAFLQERLAGMRVVQLFGREQQEARRFEELNRDHLDAHLTSITVYALYFPAIEILTTVAVASLIVVAASRVGAGSLTVGTVAAFLQLVRRFYDPLQDLSDKYNILQQAMAASERIFGLLDEPAEPRPKERRRPARGIPVTVEFEGVWFAYEDPAWVLRDVSFVVPAGSTLAIVGHTGAGKTTIVSLILGFYKPQRGRILLNGVDIASLELDELRSQIGYVQQDIFLFAGDLADNIRLSSGLTDDEVREVAAKTGVDRAIDALPGGLRYALGERGSSLSMGERQLLSFARAVAADPALLILDEATSAVDSEIEARVQHALQTLTQGRTTIAIAHRVSTIQSADQILVMHHGEVRELGTHSQLLAARGLYERLYYLQVRSTERA